MATDCSNHLPGLPASSRVPLQPILHAAEQSFKNPNQTTVTAQNHLEVPILFQIKYNKVIIMACKIVRDSFPHPRPHL